MNLLDLDVGARDYEGEAAESGLVPGGSLHKLEGQLYEALLLVAAQPLPLPPPLTTLLRPIT